MSLFGRLDSMATLLFVFSCVLLIATPLPSDAQMTFRLKGTVRDNDGKAVPGVKVRAEALRGFRGDQFVGQKEFDTTTNAKGEWTILGLTSGIWAFEATAPDVIPQVVLLPINFTNRKPISGQGGSFSWDLPLTVRRSTNAGLTSAASMAMSKSRDEAVQAIAALMADPDLDVQCAAGELALLVRQNGLANALFGQIVQKQPKHACGTLGLASTALMVGDFDSAAKALWTALDAAPRERKPALGAAVKDLQQITALK
jgi:hypothetical protein